MKFLFTLSTDKSETEEEVIESETKEDNEESISSKSEEDEATGSSATNGMKLKAKVKGKKAHLLWALPK